MSDWEVAQSKNGAVARLSDEQVFAGRQALVLEQQLPVKLPAAADKIKSAREFYDKLNDGQGGGFLIVDQRVPIQGGQQYDLRLAYRATGLVREHQGGQPGYAMFDVWIFWGNAQGSCGQVWALREQTDSTGWRQVFNPRSAYVMVPRLPYTAPADATYAQIRLQLVVNTDTPAKVAVDQVEFAPVRERDNLTDRNTR